MCYFVIRVNRPARTPVHMAFGIIGIIMYIAFSEQDTSNLDVFPSLSRTFGRAMKNLGSIWLRPDGSWNTKRKTWLTENRWLHIYQVNWQFICTIHLKPCR